MSTDAITLSMTWLIPTLTIGVLIFIRENSIALIRRASLTSAALNLALVAWLVFRYVTEGHASKGEFAFGANIPWFHAMNISYRIGADGISLMMMLLAAIIAFGGVLVSWNIDQRAKEFFIFMNVLLAGTFGCFISLDLYTFFLFNEVTLIPTYLLIGIFGSGRKEYSAMKLNLMLIGGSALILTGFLGLYFGSGAKTFDLVTLSAAHIPASLQHWAFPLVFFGFGVLGALFPFHTWSPDGHSSAPTAISMFLAGVHMKLGGYGCLRFAVALMPEGAREWAPLFLVLSTISIVYGAFVAVKHTDLKYINAYSSVSHCGLVLFGYCAFNFLGIRGAVMQMFSHGLLTAMFFAMIGMIYGRTHTRQVSQMGGLMNVMPFIGVGFTIAALAGLGLPGLSGFVAELNVFLGGFEPKNLLNRLCTILAILSIVVTAVYLLRAIHAVLGGPNRPENSHYGDALLREKIVIVLLIGTSFTMGLYPKWVTSVIDGSVQTIVEHIAK